MQQELGLERALAAANSGITLADATREGFPLTFVNAAFEHLTGYDRSEVLDRSCRFLQGPGTDAAAVTELAAALREHRECEVVLLNYRKDGSPFYNELRLAPVFDDAGRCVQIIGVQNDVTEVVRAQRSLRRATRVIAEQDQQLAELRVLQRALTPATPPPPRPQLELASCFVAAEDGVAGDFYLVAPGPGDTTVVAVGDVIGHGLEAARRATFVRTALATFSRFTDDPLRLLEMANHVLIERAGTSTEFVTALCVAFRHDEQRIVWASAGHPMPVDLATGEPLVAPQGGVPLGIEIDLGAVSLAVPFSECSGLLMFTDGLTEARALDAPRAARARLGDDRVREVVRGMAGASCDAIVGALRDAATAHAGGYFADDLCMVAARVQPGG